MRVRAARYDAVAELRQLIRERCRILYDLCAVFLERGLERLTECNRLCRNDVHEGAALNAGEDRLVDLRAEFLIASEDDAAARAAQRLVGGRGNDICMRHGIRMLPCGNQPRDMRHIHHEERTDRLCNRPDALKINRTRIRRSARNNHFGLVLLRKCLERIVVNALRLTIHAVGNDLEVRARNVDGAAVRQMPAVRQIHAEDRVARLQQRKEDRHIRLCTRMRLHIRPCGAKELLRAVNRKLLCHIDVFTAAIVPLAGIPLCVLVCEDTALRLHDSAADDVLRGDEFQLRALAVQFILNRRKRLRVDLFQRIHHAHRNSP